MNGVFLFFLKCFGYNGAARFIYLNIVKMREAQHGKV